MARNINCAPKQWSLNEQESISTFEAWRANLTYILNLDPVFAPFLQDGVTWLPKSRDPNDARGFIDDIIPDVAEGAQHGAMVFDPDGFTAFQKVANLELCLGQIANFAPIIYRNTITKESTSLNFVWQAIKLHYGFQTTGGNFIDFVNIKYSPPERAETLYQRMLTFIGNNLLSPESGILHKGHPVREEEEITPTLENLIVLLWLNQIHPNLPNVVKQKYGADLRLQSLASLKPEISLALESLIDEAKSNDNARVNRTGNQPPFNRSNYTRFNRQATGRPNFNNNSSSSSRSNANNNNFGSDRPRIPRVCPLCKAANRRDTSHFLSACKFLPKSDKDFMSRARQVFVNDEDQDNDFYEDNETGDEGNNTEEQSQNPPRIGRVNICSSPEFNTFYDHNPLTITIDTGAETNLMRHSVARAINCPIEPSCQAAFQADGTTPLDVIGETHVTLTRDSLNFTFSGLVVNDLDVDILAGVPFMEENDIAVRPKKKLITVGDTHKFSYSSSTPSYAANHKASVLRATSRSTVWPGEFLEVTVDVDPDSEVAIEPHMSSSLKSWPEMGVYKAVGSTIRLRNSSHIPVTINKNAHLGLMSSTYIPEPPMEPASTEKNSSSQQSLPQDPSDQAVQSRDTSRISNVSVCPAQLHGLFHSDSVDINPDNILTTEDHNSFKALVREFDSVFDPNYSTYNHAFGKFEAIVNMGPVKPPQRKGRIPQYSRDKLGELQSELDKLENLGVFAKPEQVDVTVEYLNPTFLVRDPKRNKSRLVTAFSEVGRYCKPQPSLMPNVDSTLRSIARWKYIIKSDLTSAYYQIPLHKDSRKYCGIATPFKGIRCYTRCAMGMPGSETALEELMCRILGDLVEEGCVTKIADDLYCGGDNPKELLQNWRRILSRLDECNLKLSARKTVIAPTKTVILGWIWSNGTLKADPHKIAPLSICSQPITTKGLRSFLGAYKVLSRVIPECAIFLQPLERLTHGKKSADKIEWNDSSIDAFKRAQEHLHSNKAITLPNEHDQLWIVTDGASSNAGIGSTLYIIRNNSLQLAGFFSQQLSPSHCKWLPCEIEGISIAAAVKYFNGFIIQSKHRTQVLTDCKACVEAYQKLQRGQFSSNARLSTFLSAVSRHHVIVQHLSGTSNLPSDFASRNPVICIEPKCQICSFVKSLDESVVRNITVQDVIEGRSSLPFTSRKAWLLTQSECRDLRRARAHLLQGTRPSKKENTIKSVKRYLNKIDMATDGLLIVRSNDKLAPLKETIVVPEAVLPGLLTALHLRLNHPSTAELAKLFKRYFWALNMDQVLTTTSGTCHMCASLHKFPTVLIPQSTSDPPASVGSQFAADVIVRERQKILVVREYVSCFTRAMLIASEKQDDLREALICLTSDLICLDGPLAVIRTDPAPGFQSLVGDMSLSEHRLSLEIGRTKNVNKNPVGEKAVQEVQAEILRITNQSGSVSTSVLNKAINSLNCRIRTDGLSAREIFFQRDQYTNNQIPIGDLNIIKSKHDRAMKNNISSERSKSGGHGPRSPQSVVVGDLIYLISDRNKNSPRNRYLVVSFEGEWCCIRKFVGNTLKSNSYRVKLAEIYKVPPTTISMIDSARINADLSEDDNYDVGIEDSSYLEDNSHLVEPPNTLMQNDIAQLSSTQIEPTVPEHPESQLQLQPGADVNTSTSMLSPDVQQATSILPPPVVTNVLLPPTPPELLTRPEPYAVSEVTEDFLPRRSTRNRRPPGRLKDYHLS